MRMRMPIAYRHPVPASLSSAYANHLTIPALLSYPLLSASLLTTAAIYLRPALEARIPTKVQHSTNRYLSPISQESRNQETSAASVSDIHIPLFALLAAVSGS
ncbi:hypothetical protein D9758_016833 [Tetrapyrgos nigripes]|uniref:Uncharacterized protein n=1 Tax=Tetrapyrgos nigripes TaxID=182062 RepID=A0A8H5C9G9_9AGAR|nr:hypothetical protein D9758_016833 [Tetrapyrgos nigripes]